MNSTTKWSVHIQTVQTDLWFHAIKTKNNLTVERVHSKSLEKVKLSRPHHFISIAETSCEYMKEC